MSFVFDNVAVFFSGLFFLYVGSLFDDYGVFFSLFFFARAKIGRYNYLARKRCRFSGVFRIYVKIGRLRG